MKANHIFLIVSFCFGVAILQSCNKPTFPKEVPSDFKIEHHYDGGDLDEYRNIILQVGECSDAGKYQGEKFDYKFSIQTSSELNNLYQELKKINAFAIKTTDLGPENDAGGQTVQYTIEGKHYKVSDISTKFNSNDDHAVFTKSTNLIVTFAELHRQPEMEHSSSAPSDNSGTVVEQTDSTMTVVVTKPNMSAKISDIDSDQQSDNYTGIPPKMPNDFSIKYEMNGGISGSYRNIMLQFGSCTEEGKKSGEAKYSISWINKGLKDFENLYSELYKLDAFTLKYTTKGTVNDRGGESISFKVNKIEYTVSDMDNNYIKPADKTTFKKAIELILAYVDKTH